MTNDLAGEAAWNVMKSVIWNDKRTSVEDINSEIQEWLGNWHEDKKLPPLPWGKSGKRRGIPWKQMALQQSSKPFHNLKGFTNPSEEMLPTPINWIGGKTSLQPIIRGIFDSVPDHTPAELFGGSGSTILGLNRDKGLYGDINPDNTNLITQLKRGMGNVPIAQSQEQLEEYVASMNNMRRRRDVLGEELSDKDSMDLARLFVGTNLQHRNGMFAYKDWDEPTSGYTEGVIQKPSFRASKVRHMPHEAKSINLDPYANRLKNVDIHTGDIRETSKNLTRNHAAYFDPQYVGRDIQYGGSKEQKEGVGFDDLQRDVLRIAGEHEGPSLYSNYMYDPKTGKPLTNLINAVQDEGFDIHPWLRKPKGNKNPVVEMLATRNFPERKLKTILDF